MRVNKMTNFLEETKEEINKSQQLIQDIIFIGSVETGHSCTWQEFKKLADFDYSSCFGAHYIPIDLCIVFKDKSKLIRSEYAGSEWWEFSDCFKEPKERFKITKLIDPDILFPWALAELHEVNEND